jgi:hypothetical protein
MHGETKSRVVVGAGVVRPVAEAMLMEATRLNTSRAVGMRVTRVTGAIRARYAFGIV